MRWHCPKCKATSTLSVVVEVAAKLVQADDNFETEIDGGDHVWDESSVMTCSCGWAGTAFDAEKANAETPVAFGEIAKDERFFDQMSGEFWVKTGDRSARMDSGGDSESQEIFNPGETVIKIGGE